MDRIERDDIEAWEPDVPPERFAEDVVHAATRLDERRARVARRARLAGAMTAALVAAAAVVWGMRWKSERMQGEAIASTREEVHVGTRAVAVLEPGAHVAWKGDQVDQAAGDVFYRVEPGATFRVHTTAGDVTVKGTCFEVAVRAQGGEEMAMTRDHVTSAGIGIAVSAMIFVGVYEGKVALSHGAASVDVVAGQGARADARGIHGPDAMSSERAAFDGAVPSDDALLAANANLANSIRDYKNRLDALDAEKKDVEARLKVAEHKLGAETGVVPPKKAFYDVDADDWKRLAARGEIRYSIPGGGDLGKKQAASMGLSPGEVEIVGAAHARSYARTWGVVEPLCAQAVGGVALADKLGMGGCVMVIMNAEGDAALGQAMRQVGAIRAGLAPMPIAVTDPAERMFLTLTAESKLFEADLAASLGPAEARRLTFEDDTHMLNGVWLPDD